MSIDNDHITHEQQPFVSLSDEQKTFLRHAIRDIPGDTVDLDSEIVKRVTAVQRRQVVYGITSTKLVSYFSILVQSIVRHTYKFAA